MNGGKIIFTGWKSILSLVVLLLMLAGAWQIAWADDYGGGVCQCRGDLNNDQDADGWDLLDFLFYYAGQSLEADLNGDGSAAK